ncbi:MAG: hypothetical protein EP330_09060 [Deltaproteobacteria bacterium]|nr:MAG: hypothetical protein EP330_09060 [Deltaproteobacteria bacterium]
MSDSVTEVTTEGFFSKLMESIKGVLFGLLLFIVAFPCLIWNEWSAVNRYQTLAMGQAAAIEVSADTVDGGNEGKLVHLSGKATTDETLTDVQFGVSENAIKLDREVEMYQWVQHEEKKSEKKVGGKTETTTTYTWSKEWKGSLVSSSSFKAKVDPVTKEALVNPSAMPYEDADFAAKKVTVGAFDLSVGLVNRLTAWEDRTVSADDLAVAPDAVKGSLQVHDGGYYLGANPSSPSIGDVRIKYRMVKPAVVTVVAAQKNKTLDAWESPGGTGSIAELRAGTLSKDEMFEAAVSDRALMSWIIRFGGFLAMFFGITMILRPFVVLGDVIPFVGNFLAMGSAILGFFLAAILSLGTIAIGWIIARPILGMVLCSITVLLFGAMVAGAFTLGRARMKAREAAA